MRIQQRSILFALLGSMLLSGSALLSGCDSTSPDETSPRYVVESYLIAGEPFRRVLVSTTAGIDAQYNFGDRLVRDATVRIDRLAADGSTAESIPFERLSSVYQPVDQSVIVQPGATYRLVVNTADGNVVSSETTVPGAFEVVSVNADSVQYQGDVQVAVNISKSVYKDRQSIFVFSIESLDPSLDALTPVYSSFIESEDDLEDVLITESPPFNQDNYEANSDGTLTIKLPWLAVAFYGPNRIVASAIDDNLFDFLRSQSIQQGGSTFSPGEIPNVITHVDGGTGVFASMARASLQTYIGR
ncbi:MAG: DUF4249 family protein [Rhodothermales bacterium]